MSDIQQHTILRFAVIFILIFLGFIAVAVKIVLIQTTEREQWLRIADQQIKTNQVVSATRGNIMDDGGRLLASSMPQYYIYMDAGVKPLHQGGDTLLHRHLDDLCEQLSSIIGDKSAQEYRQLILSAHRKNKRSQRLTKTRINYIQKKQIEEIALVKKGKNISGITFDERKRRIKPFGNMASRTLGNIDAETGVGTTGLEKRFEEYLRGTNGMSMRQRVGGRWENITTTEAIDGMDVVTTIDVSLQDIAETALLRRLERTQADWGCCILMETKTGHVKAIANLDRQTDGTYAEELNHAVTRVEPGSTFKTIALLAALEDGKVKIDDTVEVYRNGWKYMSASHTDAHPKDTVYTVQSALAVSSNIALAKIITRGYDGSARKFVRRIEKMGLTDSVYSEIPGAQLPLIRVPNDTVTLSKMAYGYSVMVTPMQLVMFYNAIANNGKMIRPVLVTEIRENGETVKTYKTETIKSAICGKRALKDIQACLHDVVWDNNLGTASVLKWNGKIVGKKAQSERVHIAGKTGTAQLLMDGKYWNKRHRMTFVGYFPEEDPQYTCLCMINYPKNSGAYDAGMDCGTVVRQIAEKTIATADCYKITKGKLHLIKR